MGAPNYKPDLVLPPAEVPASERMADGVDVAGALITAQGLYTSAWGSAKSEEASNSLHCRSLSASTPPVGCGGYRHLGSGSRPRWFDDLLDAAAIDGQPDGVPCAAGTGAQPPR